MHANYCKLESGPQLPPIVFTRSMWHEPPDSCDRRIEIRPFRTEDTLSLFGAVHESSEQLCAWMTWCRPDYNLEDCRFFIAEAAAAWEAGREFSFAILDSADGAFLGSVGINQVNRTHNVANLGYWVRRARTLQGIASAAVKLAARFGLQEAGFNRLELLIPVSNVPSQRVAVKAGAQLEGVLRQRLFLAGEVHDAVLYSLVPADFELRTKKRGAGTARRVEDGFAQRV